MKDFETLTDAEICALTPEQIAHYRDLACAEMGAPLAFPAPVTPTTPETPDDLAAYVVGNYRFATPEGAAAVAELINRTPHYDTHYIPGPGYRQYAELETDAATVTPVRLLSLQASIANREKIAAFQTEKTRYEADKKAYDDAVKRRQTATWAVDGRIDDARRNEERRRHLRDQFARYLQLAEGSAVVATRFIVRANPEARELVPELLVDADLVEPVPAQAPATVDDEIQF